MPVTLERITDLATATAACAAVAIAAVVLVQVARGSEGEGPPPLSVVEDWEPYTDGGHRIGREDAAVTIIEFGDYQCPVCKAAQPHIDAILRAYPDDVALIYRHYPLPNHQHAYIAARAAECAAEQGSFEVMHRGLYADDTWKTDGAPETLTALASSVGIPDSNAFRLCVGRTEPLESIAYDVAAVHELDVPGTPTFFVNGHKYLGILDSIFFPGVLERVTR